MTPEPLLALTPRLPLVLILGLLLALTPGLPLGLQPYNPFCLGREPKARVTTNVIDSYGFDIFSKCITYILGILLLPNCVNGTYEYIATWTCNHYVQQWMSCNIIPTIKINGCSIFVNQIPRPFDYLFGHTTLDYYNKYMCNPRYDGGL